MKDVSFRQSHLKKDCPKKCTEKVKTVKKNPESLPCCRKGYIGPKNVDLNMMLEGNPILGN